MVRTFNRFTKWVANPNFRRKCNEEDLNLKGAIYPA